MWLDRQIGPPGPYLVLALNERDFLRAAKHCKVPDPGAWVSCGANATTHMWEAPNRAPVCVVAFDAQGEPSGMEIAGVLVHEAVHVWQFYRDEILRERHPAVEQEAYAIQWIAQTLMDAYVKQTRT